MWITLDEGKISFLHFSVVSGFCFKISLDLLKVTIKMTEFGVKAELIIYLLFGRLLTLAT